MTFFIWLTAIKAIFIGSVWGRVDGGGIAKVSEWVERTLIMFFFVVACAPFADLHALWAYLGVVGIATGHGQYFLSRAVKYIGDKLDGKKGSYERVDPLVCLFFGRDPRTDKTYGFLEGAAQTSALTLAMKQYGLSKLYWRNVFGMFVTGTLVGIPAVVVSVCFNQPIVASLMLCTGFAKAIAYMIGYKFFNNDPQDRGTVAGEFINGGLRTALCVVAIILTVVYG